MAVRRSDERPASPPGPRPSGRFLPPDFPPVLACQGGLFSGLARAHRRQRLRRGSGGLRQSGPGAFGKSRAFRRPTAFMVSQGAKMGGALRMRRRAAFGARSPNGKLLLRSLRSNRDRRATGFPTAAARLDPIVVDCLRHRPLRNGCTARHRIFPKLPAGKIFEQDRAARRRSSLDPLRGPPIREGGLATVRPRSGMPHRRGTARRSRSSMAAYRRTPP